MSRLASGKVVLELDRRVNASSVGLRRGAAPEQLWLLPTGFTVILEADKKSAPDAGGLCGFRVGSGLRRLEFELLLHLLE